MDLKGKKVLVVGLARTGIATAKFLKTKGSLVTTTELKPKEEMEEAEQELKWMDISTEWGGHQAETFLKQDRIVVSPGVDLSIEPIQKAIKQGVKVISEIELAYHFIHVPIIAITGTNGKSTVTTLLGQILKSGGKDTVVCGNIGNSLCGEIQRIREDTWVVLEVSSAQLERIESFKPRIAVILNITDDHMDRYKNFYEYFNYKLKMFAHQDERDVLILNHDAENLRRIKGLARSRVLFYAKNKKSNGYEIDAYVKDDKICCVYDAPEKRIMPVADIKLKGTHNLENVLACSLAAVVAGVRDDAIRTTVAAFTGLEHRFETVDTIDNVEYIDDSKGTTVDSTRRAIESCDKSLILIAGGKDKHSDYRAIRDMVRDRVMHMVLIGEATKSIRKALGDVVTTHEAKDMFEAVEKSHSLAKDNWAVLLSPMCSSFDMFKDYKERGEVFRQAVAKLKTSRQRINSAQ
jgi:UDP-N-acetylmuramoylalanine--D-glutamate ligase